MIRSTMEIVGEAFEAEMAAVFLSRLGGGDFPASVIEKHWQEYARTYVAAAQANSTVGDTPKILRAIAALNAVHGSYAWE